MREALTQRLYVEEHGEGDPLLLIEGLGQSMWAWREQVPVFAHLYRTITFDARGTGRSRARRRFVPGAVVHHDGAIAGRHAAQHPRHRCRFVECR